MQVIYSYVGTVEHLVINCLLPTIPKCINKNFIVLDCNWANCATKFECTLNIIRETKKLKKVGSIRKEQLKQFAPNTNRYTFLNITLYWLFTQVPSGNMRRGLLSTPWICSLNLKFRSLHNHEKENILI